jgi:hypothetical protein
MNLRKKFSHFFFASFVVLALGLCHSVREGEAAASQPSKKAMTTPKKKSSVSDPSSADFEPTRMGAKATVASVESGMTDISDNPGFFTAQDLTPGPGVPQDIDKLIRPVLKKLFKDVKLVQDVGEQPPGRDGEVEENKLVYVVRLLLTEAEADQLHTELHEKRGWPASPRLGRKPTHGRKQSAMSLFKSTSLRGYSFEIRVNYETQKIAVIAYRLGAKYDRM